MQKISLLKLSLGIPTLKNRGGDKGPEPKGITMQQINGKT